MEVGFTFVFFKSRMIKKGSSRWDPAVYPRAVGLIRQILCRRGVVIRYTMLVNGSWVQEQYVRNSCGHHLALRRKSASTIDTGVTAIYYT